MACMSALSMREEELFKADDLFYAVHFDLILATLSKLSHNRKFIDGGLMFVGVDSQTKKNVYGDDKGGERE